jgi:hypothetical protein
MHIQHFRATPMLSELLLKTGQFALGVHAKAKPAKVLMLNCCFVGDKADEQLANLQLELAGLGIGLTVI